MRICEDSERMDDNVYGEIDFGGKEDFAATKVEFVCISMLDTPVNVWRGVYLDEHGAPPIKACAVPNATERQSRRTRQPRGAVGAIGGGRRYAPPKA